MFNIDIKQAGCVSQCNGSLRLFTEVREQRTVTCELLERLRIERHMRISYQKYLILAFIAGMLVQSCVSYII